MSSNCVDAVVEVALRHRRRLMLIASRRQVETSGLGGGYVESWTAEDLVKYVRKRDPEGLVLVCRDHGGPWQHPAERGMPEAEAMRSCLTSFQEDLASGFKLLHIDTSLEGDGAAAATDAVDRLISLYAETWSFARGLGRTFMLEVGIENQDVDTNNPADFEAQIRDITIRIDAAGLPRPTFIVAQTATKVVESENCGAVLTAPSAVAHAIRELAVICHKSGAALKSHNADYLPEQALRLLEASGVSALNVAPELGVTETRELLALMGRAGLSRARDDFLALAYDSGAWRKWLRPGSATGDTERAVLAGHYVFGTEEFREISKQIEHAYAEDRQDASTRLRQAIAARIEHYLARFGTPVHEMAGSAR